MSVRNVLQHIAPFTPLTMGAEALACFAADVALQAAPVVDQAGKPIGLVARGPLKLKLADKSGYELFAGASVTAVMDPAPLIVEDSVSLRALVEEIMLGRPEALHDGFVIVRGGRYLGMGSGQAVLAEIATENAALVERLGHAMNAAGGAVWEVDFERRRLLAGEALQSIYRRPIAFEDVHRLSADFVLPADREELREKMLHIAANGARGALRHRFRRGDGEERWAEHSVEIFRGADGAIARIVLLTTDITRRRRLEIDVGRSVQSIEEMLASKPQAIVQALRAFADTEPETMQAPEEALGEGQRFIDKLFRIFREIVVRDRALVAAADAAAAASEAKSRFLASMSHELRTPLNAILGYAEILEEDLASAEMAGSAGDAQRIRAAARHLLNLINEILDLSKIEAGRMDVTAESFDVETLLRDVLATTRPLADKNHNIVKTTISPDVGEAYTDSTKLNQCLMNLLSNACKFTEGGEVRVSANRRLMNGRESLVFEIADTGIGITPEQLSRLFQPFVQADASTTRNFGGTGLGLAITQRLAQLLGGDVAVSSVPGQGSTFTLHVPVHFAAPPAVQAPRADPIAFEHSGHSVLVIDDDIAARDLLRRSLSRLGFKIVEASAGAEGLKAARESTYALIVLDIQLPDMSGWSVLEALKRDEALRETPVMVLSIQDDRMRTLALGACEHLVKPVDRETISATAVRFARFASPRPTAQAPSPKILPNVA